MGRILTGCARKSNSNWKKSCEGKQGLLLFDSVTQPSSALASPLAPVNHFSSLLRGASTVSLHHPCRALDVLLDGWHQTSITIS